MTIEERLENMEGEMNRMKWHYRWLLGGLGLCFGVVLLIWGLGQGANAAQASASSLKEVYASKFVLVDETGIQRAVLAVDKNGVALELVDENDTPRVQLMVIKEGPTLNLRDEKGRIRVQIAKSNANSMAGISLYNENSISIAQLFSSRNGRPSLTLFDQNAAPRIIVGVPETGASLMALDEKGKVVWNAIK